MLILSIIVPVYNVEQYLAKCIDSLLRQDLASEEYELILVDDGSTDGSGELVDKVSAETSGKKTYSKPQISTFLSRLSTCGSRLSSLDSRLPKIRVIHQPNMGLSAARNAGLRIAEGKYVQFVDSDDYLEPNVLGGLVRQMEEQELDVLRFDYQDVREVRTENKELRAYEVYWPYKETKICDGCSEIVDGETYLNTRMNQCCYAWQFMVRRALLIPNRNDNDNCFFREGLYYEDTEWTPRMLLRANRVGATTTIVYYYLQREGSITKAIDEQIRQKEIETKFLLIDATKEILNGNCAVDWCKGMIAELVISSFSVMVERDWDNRGQYIAALRGRDILPIDISRLDVRRARKARLINTNPWLFAYIMRIKNIIW